uniref:Uncharacterized protein n=1 Tax=Parastrongyloides trichosuri TaxID=131310 RepID=A0A0N4Z007_PARTI
MDDDYLSNSEDSDDCVQEFIEACRRIGIVINLEDRTCIDLEDELPIGIINGSGNSSEDESMEIENGCCCANRTENSTSNTNIDETSQDNTNVVETERVDSNDNESSQADMDTCETPLADTNASDTFKNEDI